MGAPIVEPPDARLIAASLAGDYEAFAELARRYKTRVFGIAARFARHHHELDDLGQEIFVKAWQHLGQFRRDAPFEHWLSRIAVRTCYDALRRRRREPDQVPVDSVSLPAPADATADAARERLEHALTRLSPAERLVVTLLELQEHSVREVAALTGWSEANVKVRAFRARQSLKRTLEKDHA